MVNERKQRLSTEANEIIQKTMERRIPYYREIPTDDNPHCVSQTDLYGYTDTVIQIASERLYCGQNKSRDESRSDIVIECRGYSGKPQNLTTGEDCPVAGGHWCRAWECFLIPYFGQCDTLTYYIPSADFVGHFSRYYLEIMLSDEKNWNEFTCICRKKNDPNMFLVFFDPEKFTKMYMQTVAKTCYGEGERGCFTTMDGGGEL